MSVFDFDEYKQNHPTNLELIRFIESMDVEDVKLANRSDYNVIDSGEWIIPAGFGTNSEITYARADAAGSGINGAIYTHHPTTMAELRRDIREVLSSGTTDLNCIDVSKMVWMEKGRSDAMEIGKVSVISGHGVRAKTSKVIVTSIEAGDQLTIATDSDGITKLAKASGSDVVKAICLVAPGQNGIGANEVIFELVD